MTEQERENWKQWIDKASFMELLKKLRHDPIGSEPFQDEALAHYFMHRMKEKEKEVLSEERVRISKKIGWRREEDIHGATDV